MRVNGTEVWWNMQNQAGPEQIETNDASDFFAPHAADITDHIQITDDTLRIDFPPQQSIEGGNWGWWGVYVVILYESPDINTNVCTRIYIADESQITPQSYTIDTPKISENTPVLFSIFSSRLSGFPGDSSIVKFNTYKLGSINGPDSTIPEPPGGVQGHFYYENGVATGLNGDVANNYVYGQDGIAFINAYINWNSSQQQLELYREIPATDGGANPHPAFLITYTPSCTVSEATMPRTYTNCYYPSTPRGQPDQIDSLTFTATPGYDRYNWTPGKAFNDSTLANPTLAADSSGWYRVRMWSDDPDGLCPQTIPVFLTVGKVPRPGKLRLSQTSCPIPTGRISFEKMAGAPPFEYSVNGVTQSDSVFAHLEAGTYDLSVTDSLGCTWDSTVVITVNPVQQAAFTATPESGYSPLRVVFANQSTNSNTFQWLIDGVPFSTNKNTFYNFPDSGSFAVALVAFSDDKACSDTAYATITVFQGLEVIVPNIITPNGDGHNDNLVARVAGVKAMHWQVFNRWGNLLFSGEVSDHFDKLSATPAESVVLWVPGQGKVPGGVYTVVLKLIGDSGEVRSMSVQVEVVE